MSQMAPTRIYNSVTCCCAVVFGSGLVLCSELVGQSNEDCGSLSDLSLWDSSERIKKSQSLILIQNGQSLLSFCLLLRELFLRTVINRSGDFKLPPQICITSLEELSVIWDYCGKKILYLSIMKSFAVKLYSCILQSTVGKEFRNASIRSL